MLTFRSSLLFSLLLSCSASAADARFYVGTYTGGASEGIYLIRLDSDTGELTHEGLAAKSENPSFLAVHPDGQHFYAVNETETGEISAFHIDPTTHHLTLLNKRPSGGGAPCHLVVDATGRNLLVANYGGGSVSSFRIDEDGSLGASVSHIQHQGSSVNQNRQREPHAHSINLDAANHFAVVADLGTDELVVYRFDASTGRLVSHGVTKLTPGSGPRHFAFHPENTAAFVINELNSTITRLAYEPANGTLAVRQSISTLPRDFVGVSHTAEVRVSRDGRFVYGSNRGHDSIAVFGSDGQGDLELLQIEPIGGMTPRNFNFDATGKFLLAAGQSSNDIHVFRVDKASGKLVKTASSISVPSPVCIRFLP